MYSALAHIGLRARVRAATADEPAPPVLALRSPGRDSGAVGARPRARSDPIARPPAVIWRPAAPRACGGQTPNRWGSGPWRVPRRAHDSPPSRLFGASRSTSSPSLAMAASKPESRRDSGKAKLVLECFFFNSPRFTTVGFGGVFLGELAAEGPPLPLASGGTQKGRGRVAGGGDAGSGRRPS